MFYSHRHLVWFLLCVFLLASNHLFAEEDQVLGAEVLAKKASSLSADQVAVIVNELDPNSVEVAEYYLKARNIPEKNRIKVKLVLGKDNIDERQFLTLKKEIDAKLSPQIQAMVLMWTTPYSVSCNSITSAFTVGLDQSICKPGCHAGIKNPYFNSDSKKPFDDFGMRLTMMLPTNDVTLAKSLIDKGVLSGFNLNEATAYFLKTNDEARSKPREKFFPKDMAKIADKKLFIRTLKANSIKDKKDVMFYFTGVKSVKDLDTLNFMPGAIADHLTSFGGQLFNIGQMSSLKWLEAGATGTYGAVTEPCNFWQKFPNPQVVFTHYLMGETLIEAYWKSVYWPAQGLFLGEPLAAPYQN
jgi:uncharacterized protein (TIGR03790 family)